MIKKFKLFLERSSWDISGELIGYIDDDYIEEYYDKNYDKDIFEILDLWPKIVFEHIDNDRFVEDFIDEEISSLTFEDFGDWDYKDYIKNNLTEVKENKIVEIYRNNNFDEDDEEYNNEIEFDEDFIEDFDDDDLRKVIEADDEEEKFVETMVKDRYEGRNAENILSDFYGDLDSLKSIDLYNMVSQYIDDDDIIKDYKDNEEFEYKKETIQNQIDTEPDLQRLLLKKSKKTVLLLAELFDDSNRYNISDEYKFQKLFIKQYVKKHKGEEGYLRAKALKYLNDKFDLDYDIKVEHDDDMWLTNADKYNL